MQSRQEAEQQIGASKVKMEVLSNYFKDKEKELMRFVSSSFSYKNCILHHCRFFPMELDLSVACYDAGKVCWFFSSTFSGREL